MTIILSFEVMLPEFPIKHQYMSVASLKKLTLKTIVWTSIILKETKLILKLACEIIRFFSALDITLFCKMLKN